MFTEFQMHELTVIVSATNFHGSPLTDSKFLFALSNSKAVWPFGTHRRSLQ